MADPKMVCTGCSRRVRIDDPLEMPQWYCPSCGERRRVELNPSEPEETLTDSI